ncbi:isopeptide-forming domain-containing fimbrial protein [Enterococcus rotai]|uniref:isopeptide-forming domain-containing fimbrial protein n=1 Tax=Enterococcus rotai TaxID=118060 RepID=UPI0032B4C28D
MDWKKAVTVASIFITLVGQNIGVMTAVAEGIQENEVIETEEIHFETEDNQVTELSFDKELEQVVTVVDSNGEDQIVIVELPSSIQLDEEATRQQMKNEEAIDYNQNENKVSIKYKQKNEQIKKTNLVLIGINETFDELQQVFAKATRDDGKIYQSKPLNVVVKSDKEVKNTEYNSPGLFSGNLNVDLDISAVTDSVLSGENLVYGLNFKVTGSQTIYHNASVAVNIPLGFSLKQDLSQIQINGVTPVFNATTGMLTYDFPELRSGQAYTVNLKVGSVNGTTLDGTTVTLSADFTADEFTGNAKSEATETINASSSVSTSKAYLKTLDSSGKEKSTPPTAGDIGIWNIKISAANKNTGLLYFKEGSKIKVVDTLPDGMTYISDNSAGKYNDSEKTITWEFDAPTLDEQISATEYLFDKELTVNVKFNDDIKNYQVFKNKVNAEATNINEQTVSSEATANVMAGISDSSNPEVPTGNQYMPWHIGPTKDGKVSNDSLANPDETFYDSKIINFRFGVVPWMANSRDKDFDSYEITYQIDDHLNLRNLYIPRFNYSPDASVNEDKTMYLKGEIFATIDGKEIKITDFVTSDSSKTIRLSDFGIPENTHVQSLRLNFTEYPAGAINYQGIMSDYSIEKGYVGDIKNNVIYDVHGYTAKNEAIHWSNDSSENPEQNPGEFSDIAATAGSRTAHIIAPPANSIPVAKSEIHFDTNKNGIVEAGNNRITGRFGVDASSAQSITAPLSAMVLLPVGVKIDTQNPEYRLNNNVFWDEPTTNGNNENGKISIVLDDYSDTDRQLVKVEWDVSKLSASDRLSYGFNTIIDKNAPTPLRMDTYGFSGDAKLSVPSGASTLTDSYLQTNADNIDGSGNTTKPRVQSANQYRMVKENQIQTEKLVKGEIDSEFSKFGHTILGGKIDYQLNMTNKGNTIGNFVMMDVLPSVSDLGITDNVERGSKFTPSLTGSIKLPSEWEDKVSVQYSESMNPSRKELDDNVNYPATASHLADPVGAQSPNWKDESEISDWSKIHSYIIRLNEGKWTKGDKITLEFSMKAPNKADSSLLDKNIPESERAAWNSFAYTANNSQVVEPERVGVSIDAVDPNIEKDVEEEQHIDLTNRDEEFDWHINTAFGNTTSSWERAAIVDPINPLLEIKKVTVVDETGKDVMENGTLTTKENKVVFEMSKKDGSYAYLAGHTYKMTITTVIGKDVTEEELAPYIKDGGIPNQADLEFGGEGDVIHSEKPTVTPPPVKPEIEKDVEEEQHIDLTNRDEEFDWHINTAFGNTTSSWERAAIVDPINPLLEIKKVTVVDETGKDVMENGTLTTKENKVVFEMSKKDGSYAYLAGHTYKMTITTVIGKDVTEEELAPYIKDGGIPNQADLEFGGEGDVIHSEKPTVTPPPVKPEIEKDVEEEQHIDLTNRDEEFDWHINTAFGNTTSSWERAAIVDPINPLLEIKKVTVVDETGKDVMENGTLTTKENKVVFEMSKKDGSYAYLAGHTYKMTITTVIGKDVTEEELAPYIKDGGIPNQADLEFGGEGDVIHSEKPTVTPPPVKPEIEKDVEEEQHIDLTNRDEEFDWHINTAFGNTTSSWERAAIVDPINPLLEIKKVTVVDETGKDVMENGTLTTKENKVVFEMSKKDGSYAYLAGHTYKMTITTVIGKDVTEEELAPYIKDGGIPNQADLEFGGEGDVIHSEKPTVTPPPVKPEIEKDVEEEQHIDLTNRDEEFDWHINTAFGNTTSSWERAAIVDPINPLLEIKKVTVVDETGKDVMENGTLTTKENKVVFEMSKKDGSYAYLAGHTYKMTITTVIGKDVTEEELAPYIKDGGIPNQADLEFGGEGDVIHSEKPTVTPPPVKPEIEKDVEEEQHIDLTNRDEEFDWHINTAFGNTTSSWERAAIVDPINPLLEIKKVTVVDETGKDVMENGTLTTKENKVVFEMSKKDGSYAYLAGHTYKMTITTVIGKDVTEEELVPYIKDGGIPNQADLEFGGEGDVIHSEKPTVTPPTTQIKITVPPKKPKDTVKPSGGFLPNLNGVDKTFIFIVVGIGLLIGVSYVSLRRKTRI